VGTSDSFMHHPVNDCCWPKVAAHDYATGVRLGHLADSQNNFLRVRFSATLFVGLQMYTARIGQKLN